MRRMYIDLEPRGRKGQRVMHDGLKVGMGERTFVQPVKSNEEDGYLEYTKERNQHLDAPAV